LKGKRREEKGREGNKSLRDQSDVVRSIAVQSITCGDQSFGLIGTIDRKAIDPED
jgi:hypothetical protein